MNYLDFRKLDGLDNKSIVINCCSRDYHFSGLLRKNIVLFWDLNYSMSYSTDSVLYGNNIYCDGKELLHLQAKHALKFWDIH